MTTTTVVDGVRLNNNLQPSERETDIGALAVAANARLSLSNGGQYLLARLDPAAAPQLADATRRSANLLMDVGAAATAGVQESDPAQAQRLQEANMAIEDLQALCK